jgi:nitrogen fixation-related uncharacterized protein
MALYVLLLFFMAVLAVGAELIGAVVFLFAAGNDQDTGMAA